MASMGQYEVEVQLKKTKFVVDANDPGKAVEEAIKQAGAASNITPKAGTGPKTLKAPVK